MATLAQWESGPLPTVTGTGVSLDEGVGYPAAPSIAVEQPAATEAYVSWEFGSVTQAGVRFWTRTPSAWGSTSAILATLGELPANESRIYLGGTGSPGQIRLQRSGTQIAASPTGTITTDTWYRIELQIDGANGQARTGVFPASGTTPLWESGWIVDAALSDVVTNARVGRIGPNPLVPRLLVDSVQVVDDVSTWIGEGIPPDPPAGGIYVWDGTELVPASVHVWDGTALSPATLI